MDCDSENKRIFRPWKLVASALSDASGKRQQCAIVRDFLADSYVQNLFADPSQAFNPSTSESKSAFENLTCPIQIAPTPNGIYDIKRIKDDTKWLSDNVNINEETALRIVLVEFQSRAQNQLRGPLSTQDLVNLQDALGVSSIQASALLPGLNFSTVHDADTLWSNFDKAESRKRRLLETYFAERRYFMMSADYALAHKIRGHFPTVPKSSSVGWTSQTVSNQVVLAQDVHKAAYQDMLLKYLELLDINMRVAAMSLESVLNETGLVTEHLEKEWMKSNLSVAVHAMGVIFQILDLPGCSFTPIVIMDQWFDFVGKFGFLDGLQAVSRSSAHTYATMADTTMADTTMDFSPGLTDSQ